MGVGNPWYNGSVQRSSLVNLKARTTFMQNNRLVFFLNHGTHIVLKLTGPVFTYSFILPQFSRTLLPVWLTLLLWIMYSLSLHAGAKENGWKWVIC